MKYFDGIQCLLRHSRSLRINLNNSSFSWHLDGNADTSDDKYQRDDSECDKG